MAKLFPTWAATHIGLVRSVNEDRYCTSEWPKSGGNEQWQGTTSGNGGWALIADGMGGHGAGDIASQLAIETLSELLPSVRSHDGLMAAIQRVDDQVYEAMFSDGGQLGMGTTVVGAILENTMCTFFNVGDSRAYLMREGALRRRSLDHTPEGGRVLTYRSHALTQSLGGAVARRKLSPHIESVLLQPGDVVMLCSDGLTDLVPEEAISAMLQKQSRQPAADLVSAALAAGGQDNVTVVVLAV